MATILDAGPNAIGGGLYAVSGFFDQVRFRRLISSGQHEALQFSFNVPKLAGSDDRYGIHYDPLGDAGGATPTFLTCTKSGTTWTLREHRASDGVLLRSKVLTIPGGGASMVCQGVAHVGTGPIWIHADVAGNLYLLKLQQSDLAELTPVDIVATSAGTSALGTDGTDLLLLTSSAAGSNGRMKITRYNPSDGAVISDHETSLSTNLYTPLGVAGSGSTRYIAYLAQSGLGPPAPQLLVSEVAWTTGLSILSTFDLSATLDLRGLTWNDSPFWDEGHNYLGKFSALCQL